jgi:hypothetical protein
MKKLFRIVLVGSFTLLCFSCYYDEFPEEPPVDIDPNVPVSFADNIIPIFELYDCAQCHNPAQQEPDLTAGNEYNSLVPAYVTPDDTQNSTLYTTLTGGHRNVDSQSLEYIRVWILQGAEDN